MEIQLQTEQETIEARSQSYEATHLMVSSYACSEGIGSLFCIPIDDVKILGYHEEDTDEHDMGNYVYFDTTEGYFNLPILDYQFLKLAEPC